MIIDFIYILIDFIYTFDGKNKVLQILALWFLDFWNT